MREVLIPPSFLRSTMCYKSFRYLCLSSLVFVGTVELNLGPRVCLQSALPLSDISSLFFFLCWISALTTPYGLPWNLLIIAVSMTSAHSLYLTFKSVILSLNSRIRPFKIFFHVVFITYLHVCTQASNAWYAWETQNITCGSWFSLPHGY